MVRYTKPKRTQQKGLRPFPPYTPDTFPKRKVTKEEEELERILNGGNSNSLNPREEFLRKYSVVVCCFRLALENKEDTSGIYREIGYLEDEARSFGFKKDDLIAFNRVLRDKSKAELESIMRKLEEAKKHQ